MNDVNQNEIRVVEREAQAVLQTESRSSVFGIPKALASAYDSINSLIKSSGAASAGQPFSEYLDVDWDMLINSGNFKVFMSMVFNKVHMKPGIPVSGVVASHGHVVSTEIPAGPYLVTNHIGPYQKVGDTYRRMAIWAKENGVALERRSYECYISDPTEVPAEEIITEVLVPVRSA